MLGPIKSEFTGDGFLDTDRVRTTYEKCYRDETFQGGIRVEAWMLAHTFSSKQLDKHREDIIKMLLALQPGYRTDIKGGGSVVSMIFRGDNSMWTDDHTDIEKLLALGLALNLVSFCAPRDKWAALPGGLPYVRIEITRFGVTVN